MASRNSLVVASFGSTAKVFRDGMLHNHKTHEIGVFPPLKIPFILIGTFIREEVSNKLFDDVSALFHHLDNGMLPINVPIPVHQARKKLADIFASIIASGKKANDLLQCFIDSKYKDGRPTSESEVTAHEFHYFHMDWSLLLCNPKYMSAVLEEQKGIVQIHENELHPLHLQTVSRVFTKILKGLLQEETGTNLRELEPFAYLQIKVIWSHLLRNFEMELVFPSPEIDWNAMAGVKGKVR
ncbi:hypothetical protein SASPL_118118 [Salvia splendens]|uniref:Uncharacterized protein n=1 Tax=Salvia splendens TaxID=180675 RepID=A0A8X8Y1S4_SALSN|nr:hypothetical protein SASPL_118118 [Salvia splendens]